MAIICNLDTQYLPRDYTIIDVYRATGYASVELRNPTTSENPAAFDVEIGIIRNVRKVEGETITTLGDTYAPKNARPFDAQLADMNEQRRPQ
jgi:hypothetical protein